MGYLQSAEEALAAENWRNAAELFSKAINELRENLAAGPDVDGLVEAYSGRGQALAEMGRQRGTLPRQAATLKAALADARAAAALAARGAGGIGPVRAVKALQSILQETGQNLEEAQAAARALLDGPAARASRQVHQELQQLAQGTDTSRLSAEMDAAADDGWSPGTFRWPSRMALPELPAGKPAAAGLSDKGWGPYLRSRGGEEMVRAARANAIMLDALSFPLSLAWMLSQESVVQWPKEPQTDWELHVVVLGATSKAEVRVWRDSKYWDELAELLKHRCNIRLHFVGPEISRSSGFSDLSEVHQVEAPCAKHFFQQRPDLRPENTVCAVFNGGYGNFVASGRDELFWSWLPDLLFLAESQYLCAFFCANDYADLRGEIAVHTTIVGSRFVLAPRENPFAMATVYSGEDNSGEWFSGNAFTFATCGYQKACRHSAAESTLSDSVRKVLGAAVLKHAQTCQGQLPSVQASRKCPPVQLGTTLGGRTSSVSSRLNQAEAARPKAEVKATEGGWRLEVPWPEDLDLANVDLQISDKEVSLTMPGGHLLLAWPQPVDSSSASAAVSTRKGLLILKATNR